MGSLVGLDRPSFGLLFFFHGNHTLLHGSIGHAFVQGNVLTKAKKGQESNTISIFGPYGLIPSFLHRYLEKTVRLTFFGLFFAEFSKGSLGS